MSAPATALPPPATTAWQMYRVLVGVGLLCGILIVTVFEATGPAIRRNRIEARQRAIFDVLPGARDSAAFRLTAASRFEPASAESDGDDLVFAGYDDRGRLLGVAIEARGMGYQDTIVVLYGYAFERQAIIGMRVLDSRETPGLGDGIEKDPAFLRNFERLDVALDDSGAALRHSIEATKSGQKTSPWQVDCISGATISSRAIAEILRDSAAWWIPRIARNIEDLRRRE